jgi:hypothetical protein
MNTFDLHIYEHEMQLQTISKLKSEVRDYQIMVQIFQIEIQQDNTINVLYDGNGE